MGTSELDRIVRAQKKGQASGITSICSSHPWVLKTALQGERAVLVESTCNQVNQFGGYTGLTPADFVVYVRKLAGEAGFPPERLILGGDHLGPNVWKKESADSAMAKAADLVQAYVEAGYTKIHLDASMHLGDDDPSRPLDLEVSARRTAALARAAERACARQGACGNLRYIIGSEVPIPGGAIEHEQGVHVTEVADARRTLEATQAAFGALGIDSAWERVAGLVVQPGVEFGNDFVLDYDPAAARELSRFSENTPFVFEAHSTDYQSRENLRALVRDHFAILKVGPALTFAFREAVFGLAAIEDELIPPDKRSNLVDVLDEAMLRQPQHWLPYYPGDEPEQRHARKFSLSDRIRYYWGDLRVQSALEDLLRNLQKRTLPESLLKRIMPEQYEHLRAKGVQVTPAGLISERIETVLEDYRLACG